MNLWKRFLQELLIFLHHFFLFSFIPCLHSWPCIFLPLWFQQLGANNNTQLEKYDDGFEDTNTNFGNFMPLSSFLSCIFTTNAFSLQVFAIEDIMAIDKSLTDSVMTGETAFEEFQLCFCHIFMMFLRIKNLQV